MNRRRLKYLMLALFVGVLALVVYAAWPSSSTFTISPETTYITEPLDADGYPDYVTALNERLRGNITPETNANVLIWQALGPHPEGVTMPPEYSIGLATNLRKRESTLFHSTSFFRIGSRRSTRNAARS